MPAHAQVRPRTVTFEPTRIPPTANVTAGDRKLLEWATARIGGATHACLITDDVSKGLDVSGETIRQRLNRLKDAGMLRADRCNCGAHRRTHLRFSLPGSGAPAAVPSAAAAAAPKAPAAAPKAAVAAEPARAASAAGFEIDELIPAAPGTFALFREGGTIWRDPVVGWATWQETSGGRSVHGNGPVIFANGALEPARWVPGFCGVRIGAWRCVDEDRTYDDAHLASEVD